MQIGFILLKEFEDKIKIARKEKENLSNEKESDLETQRNKIDQMKRTLEDINNLIRIADRYVKEKKQERLNSQEGRVKEMDDTIAYKERKLQELNSKIAEMNEEIATHQLKERELQDNLKLLECESQIQKIEEKLSELAQQLGNFDNTSVLENKEKLVNEREKLLNEQLLVCGRQNELQENILRLTKTLESNTYKDADKKHINKLIELRTTELASEDLNKYYIALDRAIMRYHSMKMNEINKIIRELWMKTYAGNDIDYIEIRSDEEEGNYGLEKRRTYSYKVVMVKGDIAIDMRGRCSAGQKVLASLIIRLALAETFCLNCGILALDEPTTNLDRDNIESLAQGLAEIVQSRSHQRNFQLIIITHDEDFIDLLGRTEAVEYYYRVSKDMEGTSKITKSSLNR